MTWFRYDAPLGCTINSRFAMAFSGVAASAFSCGRQPAGSDVPRTSSREAATAIHCRRFTALDFVLPTFRGLTPTAKCCHRFAIESACRIRAVLSGEAASASSCGRQPADEDAPQTSSREAATAGDA